MRILCASDISWTADNSDIKQIVKILKSVKPSIIFFAGDVIYDSSSAGKYDIEKFLALLKLLDELKIHSILLKGNHDDDYSNYKDLQSGIKNLKYVKEIANEVIKIEGLKILGVPFGTEKYSSKNFNNVKYDFVIAHAELKKRIWLSELKSRFIITGHFDNMLYRYLGMNYVCLDLFPKYYAVIELDPGNESIIYYKYSESEKVVGKIANNIVKNDEFYPDSDKSNNMYLKHLELLTSAKKTIEKLEQDKQKELIKKLITKGIPKEQISEYIGKKRLLYKYKNDILPRLKSGVSA